MGLGFTGWFTGQPEQLREKMQQVARRIRDRMQSDESRLCPAAYEHVDTTDLVEPPGYSLLGMGLALVGLVALLMVANAYLYENASDRLQQALTGIEQKVEVESPAASGKAGGDEE